MKPALKDAQNPHLKNRYADLGSVWEAARAVLPWHGLAVVQATETVDGTLNLKTILMHTSGEWVDSFIPLTTLSNKGVNEMQALGSAITYARRYGLAAIVGVISDDDDGHAAAPPRRDQRRQDATGDDRQAVNEQFAPAKAKTWNETLSGAVAHWNKVHPVEGEPGKVAISRRKRIINSLISWAIENTAVAEEEITDDDGIRDAAKVAAVAARLFERTPKAVRKQILEHIADAVRRDRDGEKPAVQKPLASADPTLPPVPRKGDAYEEFDETTIPTEAN